jgi:hypothetical protein
MGVLCHSFKRSEAQFELAMCLFTKQAYSKALWGQVPPASILKKLI